MASGDIELEDISNPKARKATGGEDAPVVDDAATRNYDMSIVDDAATRNYDMSVTYWAYISAAILTFLSLTLLLFPKFILFLSTSSDTLETSLTPLESFLSIQLAFFLFAIAITLVLYIPSEEPGMQKRRRDALGHPLLGPLTFGSIISAFVSYNNSSCGALSLFISVLTGTVGVWGLWVLLFEGTSRMSKKTGADKHTSAFLFRNKQAASSQKKEWKKSQMDNGK